MVTKGSRKPAMALWLVFLSPALSIFSHVVFGRIAIRFQDRISPFLSRSPHFHCSVYDRQNINLIGFYVVNDAVRTFYDFPNLIGIKLRDFSA